MSSDTSVETVESYKDDRITIIKNDRKRWNGGSRNVGIDYFKNKDIDYICFLDSDDWWKDNEVLDTIDKNLYDYENNREYDMLIISLELIFPPDAEHDRIHTGKHINNWKNFEEFFLSDNTVWCTAWCRIIKKEKIIYFPECTIMEDRTWSYEQADNIDYDKVKNLQKVMYVWNRMNTRRSVSIVKDKNWEASAYKHVGEQLMLINRLKHPEMIPIIKRRVDECLAKISRGVYMQY
jgi:glycosyltransferase involved in cell wall biosynthesis